MSNVRQFSCAIGVGTAMFLSNATSANANELLSFESDRDLEKRLIPQPKKLKVALSTASFPELNQIEVPNRTQFLTASNWSFLPLPNQLSQLTPLSPQDAPEEEFTLPAILKLEVFGDEADPLILPTQPDEVTIDLEQPVTLEDSISLALTNNREVEISRLNINRALDQLSEAKAALYPSLSSSLGFDNQQRAVATADTPEGFQGFATDNSATSTFDSSLSLSYNIYDGGARGASIDSAEKRVRLNQLVLEETIEEVSLEVARDYYNLQNAEAQVEIEQAAVRDATQTLKDADVLERAGVGTKFEVLQAKVELAQARQRLNIEQANLDIARRTLSDTLNIGQKVELQTKSEIEPAGSWELSLPESIVLAYENRAELEQFALEREINAEQRQIALAANRPQVNLVASYDIREELDDDSDFDDGYLIGATVEWEFFDGGAARARARQAATDIEIDEAEFTNQRDAIRLEVEDAYYSLNANEENIDTANLAIELSEESLRLARLRFQAGIGTQSDVIDAQTELTTARGNFLSAVIEYNQSFAQLQRAISNLPDNEIGSLP